MRKRERENPCGICGHYHKYELGEVCGVCGHRPPASAGAQAAAGAAQAAAPRQDSAFPSEILKDFLFLGSYDNASRSELLKTIGISHILNTVPLCQNLYRNSFTYHCLQDEKTLQFDDAIQFLEQCERDKARVLVHCMSGKSRSAAFVIAFLMKTKGWRLSQCFQWVKERRPQVQLADAAQRQLIEYEQKLFNSTVGIPAQAFVPTDAFPSLGFGFPKPSGDIQVPIFNQQASIFERVSPHNIPSNFTFGAERTTEVKLPDNNSFGVVNSSGGDSMMDSS
ncbi:Os06g0308100 [Oryza sativa Japonica Group]|uniref:Os06g0308100 protein n=2 Tax=Oryza sativa subsp. japonica TaxID=39947 RepID=Q0DCN6_ORYSJ|nr:Os06g0308100 [Oryza sativa Japonica Group]BAS97420.1 Os06g0308100 [Oryza sativa Japonica Group]|eukprot:NP_001057473.1 Os06g0308100 [Oryza sativa Japonica Group]